jgi:DNA-binding NarL/FixJ family response regulator
MPICVVIADDHELIRTSLGLLLEMGGDIEILAEASNGQEAVHIATTLQPDVVLMDINMPLLNGIEATRRIVAACPQIGVIGLSMYDDPDTEAAMRAAGAIGYVRKYATMETLLAAVRAAVQDDCCQSGD